GLAREEKRGHEATRLQLCGRLPLAEIRLGEADAEMVQHCAGDRLRGAVDLAEIDRLPVEIRDVADLAARQDMKLGIVELRDVDDALVHTRLLGLAQV